MSSLSAGFSGRGVTEPQNASVVSHGLAPSPKGGRSGGELPAQHHPRDHGEPCPRGPGASFPPEQAAGCRPASPGRYGGTALPSLPCLRGRGCHPCPFCGRREGVCAAGFFHPCIPLSHFLPERVRSCSPAAAWGADAAQLHGAVGRPPWAPRASPGATSPDLGDGAELHLWQRHGLGKRFSRAAQRWSTLILGSPALGHAQRGRLVPFQKGDAGSPWRDPHGGWPVRATRRVSLRAAGWDVNLSVSPEAFPPCPTALGAPPSTRSRGNICPVDLAALSRESAGSGPTSQMGNRSHEPRGKAASCLWSREESRNSCLPAFFGSFLREPLPGVSNQPGVSRWQEHRNHGRKPAAGSFTPSRAWPPELLGYAQVPRHGVTWGSLCLRFPILNTRS